MEGRRGPVKWPEFDARRAGHRDRNRTGVRQRRQLLARNAVSETRQKLSCDLKADPGLADASGANQGDEAARGHEPYDLLSLGVAANQFGNRVPRVRESGRRYAVLIVVERAAPTTAPSLRFSGDGWCRAGD
jgi:hypothetical protein